ncbi:MAG: ChaN family lipoprotein [Thalassovita sp.]
MSFRRLLMGAGLCALPLFAQAEPVPQAALSAQIVVLGETHDNPGHHQIQAQWISALRPTAIVFEMLSVDQAKAVTSSIRGDAAALDAALGWSDTGWPDFAMYFPVFNAAPDATIYGAAVPRDRAQQAMADGIIASFGSQAARYGLSEELPEAQLNARLALQAEAHCGALPETLLPAMVQFQRLRDATLAQTAVQALQATQGPVVVITGNGHARADWAVPYYIGRADAQISVFALGQGEGDIEPGGRFDLVRFSPSVERDDPCDVFN